MVSYESSRLNPLEFWKLMAADSVPSIIEGDPNPESMLAGTPEDYVTLTEDQKEESKYKIREGKASLWGCGFVSRFAYRFATS